MRLSGKREVAKVKTEKCGHINKARKGPIKTYLSGWNFSATEGYTSGDPAYLSLFAGDGTNLSELKVWHFEGSTWTAYTANDLAYDGKYASFTVTDFSGYAVSGTAGTAPVPIPPAILLLGSGLARLGFMRRRFFNM
jgi:hypothetical protein